MAMCGRVSNFEPLYTGSLKRALGMPMSTPNEQLLKVVGMPSLAEIVAHQIVKNTDIIRERFPENCPESLTFLAEELKPKAAAYDSLHSQKAFGDVENGEFSVDLLFDKSYLNKSYVGLSTRTFLTIRAKAGQPGSVSSLRYCPVCNVPATQHHFINSCPCNENPRAALFRSIPANFKVEYLKDQDYNKLYENIRHLKIAISARPDEVHENLPMLYSNLAKVASLMAELFVSNALKLFNEERT